MSLLKELNPRDVLIEESAGESTSLAASLVRVEESIASITSEMEEHGESPVLFKRLRQKEAAQKKLAVKLAEDIAIHRPELAGQGDGLDPNLNLGRQEPLGKIPLHFQ